MTMMKFEPRKSDMLPWHALVYKLAVNERHLTFAKLKPLVTRIIEALRNTDPPEDDLEDIEDLARKLQ